MTDGQKLALLLYRCERSSTGGTAFNVEGGIAFDRVARKARDNGLIVLRRSMVKHSSFDGHPIMWTFGYITEKGRSRLAALRKAGKVPELRRWEKSWADLDAEEAQKIGAAR